MVKNTKNWSINKRLEYIDFCLFWEGRLNRSDLVERFNISVPQAVKDIRYYLSIAKETVVYDTSVKTYMPANDFKPLFLEPKAEHYFSYVEENNNIVSFDRTPVLYRMPSPYILRDVVFAIRDKKSLLINYQPMSVDSNSEETISPHSLAYADGRWHTRAYSKEREGFFDYTLTRISEIKSKIDETCNPNDDKHWQEYFKLILEPNPNFNDVRKKTVERDYNMVNGCLEINVRKSLLFYLLNELRQVFDDDEPKITPAERYPIVVKNWYETKKCLLEVKEQRKK